MEDLTPEQIKAIEMIKSNDTFICSIFTDVINKEGDICIRQQTQYSCQIRHLKKHTSAMLLEIFESETEKRKQSSG